jgi:protein-disulfide isomerase
MSEKNKPNQRRLAKQRQEEHSQAMQKWLIWGGFAIVVIAILFFVLRSLNAPSAPSATSSLDKSEGPQDAAVVIREYGDFQCPACKQFALQITPKIKEEFVKTGKVRFEFRQMAFVGNESLRASEASECANDQGKFWEFYEKLYQEQNGENVGIFSDDNLNRFAQDLNLNMDSFKSCMSTSKYAQKVKDETLEGEQKGVRQTPSVLINGALIDWGGDYTKLAAEIQKAIQSAK